MAQEHTTPSLKGTHRGDALGCRLSSLPRQVARGLTLVELLVTIAIVSILMSLLLPGLSQAQAAARRIVCAANEAHIGIGLTIDADQNNQRLVRSWFAETGRTSETMAATIGNFSALNMTSSAEPPLPSADGQRWDGLGKLAYRGSACLDSHQCLYCPCHRGEFTLESEQEAYRFKTADSPNRRYFTNYQYSGHLRPDGDPKSLARLSSLDALVSDGFRTRIDINHGHGGNVLRGDLSVDWWAERLGEFDALPTDGQSEAVADTTWIDPANNPWSRLWTAFERIH